MWNLVLGPIINGVREWNNGRQAIKQAKVEGEIKAIQQAAENIADWERLHAKGAMSSWKDEYVLILWTVPVILCFVPGGLVYAVAGFQALSTLPQWYTYTLVTLSLASFGIRIGDKVKGMIGK